MTGATRGLSWLYWLSCWEDRGYVSVKFSVIEETDVPLFWRYSQDGLLQRSGSPGVSYTHGMEDPIDLRCQLSGLRCQDYRYGGGGCSLCVLHRLTDIPTDGLLGHSPEGSSWRSSGMLTCGGTIPGIPYSTHMGYAVWSCLLSYGGCSDGQAWSHPIGLSECAAWRRMQAWQQTTSSLADLGWVR